MRIRSIHTKIWQDDWFTSLSISERLLFLYAITNPYISLCGVYELSDRVILFDTGLTKDQLEKAKETLKDKILFISGWVIIKNIEKYDDYKGSKLISAKENQLAELPEEIKNTVSIYRNTLSIAHDGVSIPVDTPNSNSNSNSNNTSNKDRVVKGKEKYLSYLDEFPDTDIDWFTSRYKANPTEIRSKARSLATWCRAKGKEYKDYKQALAMAIQRDFGDRDQTKMNTVSISKMIAEAGIKVETI